VGWTVRLPDVLEVWPARAPDRPEHSRNSTDGKKRIASDSRRLTMKRSNLLVAAIILTLFSLIGLAALSAWDKEWSEIDLPPSGMVRS